MSVDEERNAGLGRMAIQTFSGSPIYFDQPSLDEHGPAYFMFFAEASQLIDRLSPHWTLPDGRHLTNYLMFLVAITAFYFLSLRYVSRRAAWGAAALFATQPLLFGQAFINQKDIPFLALVLSSLAVGLAAADRLGWSAAEGGPSPASDESAPRSQDPWGELRRIPAGQRLFLAAGFAVAVLVAVDLAVGGFFRGIVEGLVVSAYAGHAPSLVQAAFDRVATDAYKTPLSLYIDKLGVAWFVVRMAAPVGLGVFSLALLNVALPRSAAAWGWSWRQMQLPRSAGLLLVAAVLLGLTICVRQLGLFFGVLVSLYALYRGRARAVLPLVIYWLLAYAVTIATWPYLWPNPVTRFVSSLYLSANFPDTHVTLYRGAWLRAGTYPWYFFPNLAGIELTEPAVVLILGGLWIGVRRVARRPSRTPQSLLLAAWFGVPLVGLIAFHMTTYGNITHLLFVLPAFFIFAAMGLEFALTHLAHVWVRALLIAVCLLPGLWGIITLHPYEYIYVNSFAGGVSGAAGFYELDRWCVSLREAIQDVNQIAPQGSTVMLPSSYDQAVPFARPDLRLIDNRTSYDQAQFVIQCTWIHGLGPWPEGEFKPIGEVRRGNAVLASIWRRQSPP